MKIQGERKSPAVADSWQRQTNFRSFSIALRSPTSITHLRAAPHQLLVPLTGHLFCSSIGNFSSSSDLLLIISRSSIDHLQIIWWSSLWRSPWYHLLIFSWSSLDHLDNRLDHLKWCHAVLPIATTGRLGSDPVERLERGVHVRNVDNFFLSKKFKPPGSGCTC